MTDSCAHFSADRKYRYLLGRRVSDSPHRLLFVMLNPATADETSNDPTIRRCIGFAKQWNFGLLDIANLFAFRTAYPSELRRVEDPIGPENDKWIYKALSTADRVILAWGNHGSYRSRSNQVKLMALKAAQPYHLGLNKTGEPKHPLYLPAAMNPEPMHAVILTHEQID